MDYFELGLNDSGAWSLADPQDEWGKSYPFSGFSEGIRFSEQFLATKMERSGWVPDIYLTTFGCVPIVKASVGALLSTFCGDKIQRIPLKVDEYSKPLELINLLSVLDCVDEKTSGEVAFYSEEEFRVSGKKYKHILQLKVERSRVPESHLFRVKHWTSAVIVSKELRDALESSEVKGIAFHPV